MTVALERSVPPHRIWKKGELVIPTEPNPQYQHRIVVINRSTGHIAQVIRVQPPNMVDGRQIYNDVIMNYLLFATDQQYFATVGPYSIKNGNDKKSEAQQLILPGCESLIPK